jgi:predicted transcriptional regulator
MFTRLGPAIALALIVFGIVSTNFWLVMGGIGILLGAQIERQGLLLQTDADIVRVSDVMLTEYSILSASATLEDAVDLARHTLQDVFPVVRAGNMVGAVARQNILEALESTGNGYVQGIMTRTFQTAAPGDSLIATLNKVTSVGGASSQMVPVVDGERIVGIITPQNLQRSMGLLTRKARRDSRVAEDEGD